VIPRPPTPDEARRANNFLLPEPTAEAARPRMKLLGFRPLVKRSLRGFAHVELDNGLRISDIPVFAGHTGCWANLPARPQIDKDFRAKPTPTARSSIRRSLHGATKRSRIGSPMRSSAWFVPSIPRLCRDRAR
jgi:DNA-binding cell septation regulator SpoVG